MAALDFMRRPGSNAPLALGATSHINSGFTKASGHSGTGTA